MTYAAAVYLFILSLSLSLSLSLPVMLCRLTARGVAKALLRCCNSIPPPLAAGAPSTARAARFFGTGGGDAYSPPERLALDMIRYALDHARAQKSSDSYGHAMLVLEQGLSNLRIGAEVVEGSGSSDNAMGMLLLAMSTLHYERGELKDSADKLEMVHKLGRVSLDVKVAAWESCAGLDLEAGQDVNALLVTDNCSYCLQSSIESGLPVSKVTQLRAKSIKGFVDLVNRQHDSLYHGLEGDINQLDVGASLLSWGEVSHCVGNFSLAKECYAKALLTSEANRTSNFSYLASANMVPEEVIIGANCALGQHFTHSGKFEEAEELLTKALVKAEEHFGLTHPKVGVVLTCIAIMYKHKAQKEASSSILIQEGLYRKAIDLLKAPMLDCEDVVPLNRSDVIALARAGYADLLCIQQNRKEEGERMKKWAQSMWKNRRLSLAEALEFSDTSKPAVVDTRICRVL
ncbi:hypothetical protein Cni_G13494 [Canna indica]|uniref:Uncharacterized protein n=1 Tax=Canna indica TaxID=4628 RepID=A0AAQ3KE46_9LILI|nr:hypothetical protein Cni_G13494 [Canna indica]